LDGDGQTVKYLTNLVKCLTSYPETVTDLHERRRSNLGRLLFRGYRAINNHLLAELRAAGHEGLRLGHVAVLSNLDLSEGTRLVTLAERAGVTKQAIGPVVRELERLGYARTDPDPTDGRAKLVGLTSTGRRVIDDAQPVIDRIEAAIGDRLGGDGFDTLGRLLTHLLDGFEEGDAAPQR
jgi:DNA-binding MarR family transcriptional regulator